MDDGWETDAGGRVDVDDATSMRRFLDMSIDLLAVLDLQTTILEASQSFQRTLGWAPAELIGRPLLEFFHEEDMARIEAELAGLLIGGEALAVVVRVRGKDGDYRWVQGNARSDLDAGRIYVTAADITERKKLEDALLRRLELEALVVSITSRFVGTDSSGMGQEIERGLQELAEALGADRAHFLRGNRALDRVSYFEWIHPERGNQPEEPDPLVRDWWFDTMRTGVTLQLDDIAELADEFPEVIASLKEQRVRSLLHVPLPFQRSTWGFLALVTIDRPLDLGDDVLALLQLAGESFMTALARADDGAALLEAREELERRNEALERTNDVLERTNEELEGFAYAAAHDLKAPLSRVEMALAATASLGGPADELLDIARRATFRMGQLIEDLLTFAAAGSAVGAVELVDLDEVLVHVLSDLEPLITAAGIHVDHAPLPEVWGHRSLLGQLLQNLVGNAVKFARPGTDRLVRVDASEAADGVTIAVRDNGIGIPPDHRSEVFGVFTRLNTPDAFAGSGIGLATCAKVVRYHGGRIWIEDGLDGGTAVRIWLPSGQSLGHDRV